MKNSISEPAENFNSKSALNFILDPVRERAKNTALNSASNAAFACAKNTARGGAVNFASTLRFKRNFKFQDAVAELNFIRGRNLKFYPASAGFAARNRVSCDLAVLYSAPRVKNIERKPALNSAALALNLKPAQIPSYAENRALNSAKFSKTDFCENSARNFRQNFILNFMGNSTHGSVNSASPLSRANVANDPNLIPAKSLVTAYTRHSKKNFNESLANDPGFASMPQSFNYSSAQSHAQNPAPPSRLWDLGLLFVAIVWGCTFVPVQRALHSGDVFSFLFWRFLAASIFTYLACLRFGVKFDRGTIGRGVFCGLMLFCDFSCQTIALDYALSSTVAFILGLNVVIVPFLMLAFFGKKVGASAFGGAVVALLGLYFLSGVSGAVGFGIGERLTLISAFAYALHIVFTGVCARKRNLYGFVIVQFICVCVCALIAAVFTPHLQFEGEIKVLGNLIFSPSFDFVFALVLTSIFATVAAFVIQTMAQNRGVSEIKTVLIFALEPVSAGVMGYAFGEKLSALQILGAALILAGILLSELGGLLGAKFAKDRAREKADRGD